MNVDFASMAPMETEESAEWNCQPFICSLPTSVEPEESLSDLSDLTESEEEVATERHHTRQHKKQHRKRQVQRVIRSAQRAAVQASAPLPRTAFLHAVGGLVVYGDELYLVLGGKYL
ncbi:hypothetical protein ONZ45_g13161 [Pleurotus djamor]|nr:hypothetical protein ONZ45_g13161 [Pleurotus djamor]